METIAVAPWNCRNGGRHVDNSTDGVMLLSSFVFDVVNYYRDKGPAVAPLTAMLEGLDESDPESICSIELYNTACQWIEDNLGPASIRKAGREIGRHVAAFWDANKLISENPMPIELMQALKGAADVLIKDPKGRGWTVREELNGSVTMIRTQTFNCMLQEGLLLSLVERANVKMPRVEHLKCTRRGDAFCEYNVHWFGLS